MMFYTAAVNGVFAFFAGGLLLTAHGVTPEFLLSLLFYIIITPVISLTLTRMIYMSESKMVVDGSQNGVCRSAKPASGGRFAEELQPAKKHPQQHCRAVLAHVQSAADAFLCLCFHRAVPSGARMVILPSTAASSISCSRKYSIRIS